MMNTTKMIYGRLGKVALTAYLILITKGLKIVVPGLHITLARLYDNKVSFNEIPKLQPKVKISEKSGKSKKPKDQ